MLPDNDGPSAIAVRPDNTARAYAGYEGAGLVGEWELGIDGASRLLHVGPLPGSAEKEHVVVRDIAAAPGRSHEVLAATEEEVWRGPAGAAGFKLSRHIGAPLAWRALENLYLAAVAIGLAVVVFVLIRRAVREQKPDHEMAMLQAVGVGVFLLVMAVEGGPLTVFAVFPRWSVTVYAVLLSVILVYAVRRQSVYLVDPGRVAEGLIAGIEAPVVVADFAGRVIAANQGAHTSFRTYTDGLCGTALSELAGNVDGIDGTDLPLEQFARENRSVPSVCRSEEGSSFDCILSFSYLKNRAGQDIGYIISVTHSRGLKTPENRFGFTDREMEILRLLVQGMSYREIADRLFISLPTVKSHVHNIYEKSGARNRLHLSRLVE
jgi:DNA-binding CsgD family transcriptional regulator